MNLYIKFIYNIERGVTFKTGSMCWLCVYVWRRGDVYYNIYTYKVFIVVR